MRTTLIATMTALANVIADQSEENEQVKRDNERANSEESYLRGEIARIQNERDEMRVARDDARKAVDALRFPTTSSINLTEKAAHLKDLFDAQAADNKINVIKAVRSLTGLGLKESKDLVEILPQFRQRSAQNW